MGFRCLLEIQDGRLVEATRWLCRGLAYNLHVPELVLSGKSVGASEDERCVVVGSISEAAEYLQRNKSWTRKEPKEFLRRLFGIAILR